MYSLQNRGIKLGLEGIRALLGLIGHPETAFPCVLVGGTNGKGSVSAMIDAMLAACGRRSGLYTSPHLVRPNERIRIAGADIESRQLDRVLEALREVCESGVASGALAAHPSFFEVITAAALVAFRDARVDVAVLEVGLGGRLDATNAVDPRVSVIVTVDFDHVGRLGASLASIAEEKAGIIRPGRTLITGVEQNEPLEVIRRRCRDLGAPLLLARDQSALDSGPGDRFTVVTSRRRYDDLRLPLAGEHQRSNARVAIVAFEEIARELGITHDAGAVRCGLARVRWPGRLQWIDGVPPVLLDGAHNAAGAAALARHLDERSGPRPVLLFAAMRDKDLGGILGPLAARADAVVTTQPVVERAAQAAELTSAASRWAPAEAEPDSALAFARARALAQDRGTFVLVAGSLYLIGEVLAVLNDPDAPGPVSM